MIDTSREHPFLKYSFYVTVGFLCLSLGYKLGKWVMGVSF